MDEKRYTVLILAPQGQDAKLAAKVLAENDIMPEVQQDMWALCDRLKEPCGAIIISEEAINDENMPFLNQALKKQPPWSDIPIILVTLSKNTIGNIKHILDYFGAAGNISILDRPFNISTFITMIKVALRAREKQYQVQELLRKRDEFMSIASHELRTPITALRLQVQLRKRSIEKGDTSIFSPEKVRGLLDVTDNQVERLYRLIDEMLDVSRIDNGKLELNKTQCDLGDIVSSVVELMSPHFITSNVELKVKFESDAHGEWDRHRIEQVVINLLTNALKYGNSLPVSITVRATDGFGEVRVQDNGKGISEEDLPRVFDRFERAKNVGGISGLGLGLYISKEIVKMHGGSLEVQSELGKGSTFTMRLPTRTFNPQQILG